MHPILLKLGPFTIYSYGAMLALGFGLAALLIYRRAGVFNLDKNFDKITLGKKNLVSKNTHGDNWTGARKGNTFFPYLYS